MDRVGQNGVITIEKAKGLIKVDDAIQATRAAGEDGIVSGGVRVVLLHAQKSVADPRPDGKRAEGAAIVRRALEEPLRQIAANAGHEPAVVGERVRAGKDDFGFNALTEAYEPLLAAGVIDPVKVVRTALQNAASVAGLLLTTEAAIAEKPEKKKGAGAPSGGEDMDDDY